jgi:hypothetical protein
MLMSVIVSGEEPRTEVVGIAVTIYVSVPEVLVSNLGRNTGCFE